MINPAGAGRPARWIAAALAAVMALTVAVPPPTSWAAPALPADGYGFGQGGAPVTDSFDTTNRELDAVAATTASWLRVPVEWNAIEATRGQYDWGYLDNMVNSARARNLRILATIGFTPAWARPQGLGSLLWTTPPANAADFAGFARQVVQRYGDRISVWQIWNEPNLGLFFGFTDNKAAKYTELVRAVYPAIKSVQPNSTVVLAGLSRLSGGDAPPNFLNQLYANGIQGSFDAAAAHPYVFPGGLATDPENGWSDVARMHDVMTGNGDGAKKIWMTELGAPTSADSDGVSQQEQARQISDVLGAIAALPYAGPAFIYSIRDLDSAQRSNREANFGALLTSDFQPKAAAALLAR